MSKLAFRAQTVDIAYLPLRQDLLAKTVLMTVQRDFRSGNSLFAFDVFRDQIWLLPQSPPCKKFKVKPRRLTIFLKTDSNKPSQQGMLQKQINIELCRFSSACSLFAPKNYEEGQMGFFDSFKGCTKKSGEDVLTTQVHFRQHLQDKLVLVCADKLY